MRSVKFSASGRSTSRSFQNVSRSRNVSKLGRAQRPAGSSPCTGAREGGSEFEAQSGGSEFEVKSLGRGMMNPEVEVPEGNGTGFVFTKEGDIVTNYHVLASALKKVGAGAGAGQSSQGVGQKVARVTLLGADGYKMEAPLNKKRNWDF
eukprot:gene24594-10213_t